MAVQEGVAGAAAQSEQAMFADADGSWLERLAGWARAPRPYRFDRPATRADVPGDRRSDVPYWSR